MGTRSITTVTHKWDNDEPRVDATIYRHWDGYPTCHGRWLADFLRDAVVTNGKVDEPKHFNGPGRLAAGICAQLQADEHDPDLVEAGAVMGQEYEYRVHVDYGMSGGKVSVTVFDGPMTMFGGGGEDCNNQIFSGTVKEFEAFIQSEEKREAV